MLRRDRSCHTRSAGGFAQLAPETAEGLFRGTRPKSTASIPRTIALNALHDRAFDRGLITFDTELRLVCAPSLQDHFAEATVSQSFKNYEGKPLTIPAEAAGPKAEYLEWHRSKVFGK